jgi:ABC-type antimicrobial peptide transport system permease subunit
MRPGRAHLPDPPPRPLGPKPFGLLAAIALGLSAAGLYALVSFTVSERQHEIGIRTALGARSGRIVRSIVGRALLQVAVGIALGAAVAVALVERVVDIVSTDSEWPLVLAVMSAVMLAIGVGACARPTLRALRIQPSEALKE